MAIWRTLFWVGVVTLSALCWWVAIVAAYVVLAIIDPAEAAEPYPTVDVALVLAADASGSVDENELKLQREGYAAALTHPEVVQAITNGAHGRIMVAYFEWSGCTEQGLKATWAVIDGPETARAFAASLVQPGRVVPGASTCPSAALTYAGNLLALAPEIAERNVIDISGDGVEVGAYSVVHAARDALTSKGVTINAMPIISAADGPVQAFYTDHVVGGPGSFVEPARDFRDLEPALRRKLLQEVG